MLMLVWKHYIDQLETDRLTQKGRYGTGSPVSYDTNQSGNVP